MRSRLVRTTLWVGAAFALVAALVAAWGVGIEPRLIDERRFEVHLPDLPAEWEGQRLAFIADLQVGMWLGNTSTIRRIVGRIVRDRPAAVLLGGDFIYHPLDDEPEEAAEDRREVEDLREEVGEVINLLRPISEAGLPVYAVLGNHDYGMGWPDSFKTEAFARMLRARLEEIGVVVLQNRAVPLGGTAAGAAATLYLVGIGPHYPNEDDVTQALAGVPADAPRVMLMHNPQTFQAVPPGAAPLGLAAHTHGGQVRIPFLPDWSYLSLLKQHPVAVDGWVTDSQLVRPGNRLYINRGIGFSAVPVRLNCRPELTYLTLRSSPGAAE